MSTRYIRHPINGSVILPEREAVDNFRVKASVEDRLNALRDEIDTVKRELHTLKEYLKPEKDSE